MFTTDTIKVHVVYGDALVAAGLSATLRGAPGFSLLEPAGAASTEAAGAADVVVTDYEHGLRMLARAAERPRHAPPVLIVTARDTESEIRHALEQGARGYLLLGCSIDELVTGVRALCAGMRHIAGRAAQRLADSVACEALTGREQAVLQLVVVGLGNKAIARRLDIALGTVKSHLKSIFQKLDAASRTEVAAIAERRGLLSLAGTCAGGRPGAAAINAGLRAPGAAELERHQHAAH